MEMTSLNIDLPEPLKVFVEIEAEESGYETASDYIRALIRDAEQRKSERAIESLLLEDVHASDRGTLTDAEWASHLRQVRADRLERLRKEVAAGLDDAAHDRVHSADEVFRRLESRKQQALNQR